MDLTIYQHNQVIFGSMLFIVFYSFYSAYYSTGEHSITWDILLTSISFFLILFVSIVVANLSLDF